MPTRLYNQQKSAAGKPAADHFLLCVAMAAVPQRCLSAPLRGPVVLSALKDLLRGEAKNPRPPSCHFAFCILRSLAPVPGAGGKARRADCPRYRLVQTGSGGQAMLVPTGGCGRVRGAMRASLPTGGCGRGRGAMRASLPTGGCERENERLFNVFKWQFENTANCQLSILTSPLPLPLPAAQGPARRRA